ncbi:hypothetical protein P2H44_07615 [Albimonas sp. CAU 1670]|uniref:STING domain-containing protein n=1 Tax=Albimonas sp. CAU 1670 TaxID=3032599 RepID=UPI0023DAA323|nr:STING domain-containing protein [Albimonas sp. CAU 1670]MDF2232416.1 hypothetical protein [Albimonas sp. CAU 1670]
MQELRVFVLGRMVPEGDFAGDNYRYVRRTKTVSVASIIEGAAAALYADGKMTDPEGIRVFAPEADNRTNIVLSVLNHIESSDLVIVDVSDESPSVIYELGAVNALGKPYILVTGDSLPFYLLQSRAIMQFAFKDEYDPSEQSHVELRNRLLDNYRSPDGAGFSESVFSAYFQGLPIVNIAGPAGIATGYHVNTLYRFGRSGSGFLQKVTKVVEDRGGASPTVWEGRLTALVVVIPDIVEIDNFDDARHDLEFALESEGLPTMSASILEKQEEGEYNKFGFGGMMLRDRPDIVIDIPRTVYPLSMVPRVRIARENENRFGAPAGRRRQIRRLMREFKAILDWNIANERAQNDGAWTRIHFVAQANAASYIRKLVDKSLG